VAVPLRLQRRRGNTDSCELHGSAPYGRFAEVAGLVRPGVALILLLHFLIPLGSLLALLWFVMVAVLMLAGDVGSTDGPRGYTVRR
jgi:hypothetical protein